MEELAGRDNIVTCAVPLQRAHSSALALKRAFDEGLGRAVVLIWERDIVDISWRSVGIDKHFLIALDEATPLKVGRNSLGCTDHIAVHALLPLGLAADVLKEGAHGLLDGLYDVCFELLEALFDGDQVLPVVVLLQDLLVEMMMYGALKDVRVIVGLDLAARRVQRGRVLAKELNVLLRDVPCFFDVFGAFVCTTVEFF